MIVLDTKSVGFSLANAKALAQASADAYTAVPTIFDADTDTQVVITELDNCIIIAFRGSSSIQDFITDARAWRDNLGICTVHRGFYRAMVSVEQKLEVAISAMARKPLFVTGHSLGGALAQLFAFGFLDINRPIHSVYTYGQPRVGDYNFACLCTLGIKQHYRVVNAEDIVPRSPGWLAGYHHSGDEEFLDSGASLEQNPTLWAMALSDWSGLCKEWNQSKRLALLADHGIDRYIAALNKL